MKKLALALVLSAACGQANLQSAPCSTGALDCACFPNGTCNAGLACDAGVCGPSHVPTGNGNEPDTCSPTSPADYAATSLSYSCAFGLVDVGIDSFTFADSSGALSVTAAGTSFGAMQGAMPTCPSGSFSVTTTVPGGCCESYTLEASFTSANSWQGDFTMTFCDQPSCGCASGDGFSCSGAGLDPCQDQALAVTGTR